MTTQPKKATKNAPSKRMHPEPEVAPAEISERGLPDTFDTDEEPRGRGQVGAPHTHDDVDDEAESETDATDVQTGLYGRRGDGGAT